MTETHVGSCHCGAIRFKADVDLSEGTSKCNCSICAKTRYWKVVVTADAFRLRRGADALTDYRVGSDTVHHRFCSRCGVKPFGRGSVDELGGDFYAVNVACLDDVTDEELAEAPVTYEDGRHDDWESTPAETRHL
ncbi:GFA family protein [Natronorubrum sp. FCH18a]|uniref:GFA family protein n=1 Tax=Natronorubrum sp. FCH18a TaxID=3447018 RepID=UPI003F517254